jgi:hypothetical protein
VPLISFVTTCCQSSRFARSGACRAGAGSGPDSPERSPRASAATVAYRPARPVAADLRVPRIPGAGPGPDARAQLFRAGRRLARRLTRGPAAAGSTARTGRRPQPGAGVAGPAQRPSLHLVNQALARFTSSAIPPNLCALHLPIVVRPLRADHPFGRTTVPGRSVLSDGCAANIANRSYRPPAAATASSQRVVAQYGGLGLVAPVPARRVWWTNGTRCGRLAGSRGGSGSLTCRGYGREV